jgi:hypothetical protein
VLAHLFLYTSRILKSQYIVVMILDLAIIATDLVVPFL